MNISFKLTLENNLKVDSNYIESKINEICDKNKYYLKKLDTRYVIGFYSLGLLYIRIDDKQVVGDVLTFHIGPGFHVFILDFIYEFANLTGYNLEIKDESKYLEHKDINKLQEDFISKLKKDFLIIKFKNIAERYYFRFDWKVDISDAIITNVGLFKFSEISEDTDFRELAKRFFVWFNKEKDEYFYRNLVYYFLWSLYPWVKPRFEIEEMLTKDILDYSNKAYELNPNIDLPNDEIRIVKYNLGLIDNIDIDPNQVKIGYRREKLDYPILQNIYIKMDGFYSTEFYDNGIYFYDDVHFISIFIDDKNENIEFNINNEYKNEINEEINNYKYKGVYFKSIEENLWVLAGEILGSDIKCKVIIKSKLYYDYDFVYQTFISLAPYREVYNYFELAYLDTHCSFLENGVYLDDYNVFVPYDDIEMKMFINNNNQLDFIMYFKEGKYPVETGVIPYNWHLHHWIEKYNLKVKDIDLTYEKANTKKNKKKTFVMKANGYSKVDIIVLSIMIAFLEGLSILMFFSKTWWVGFIFLFAMNLFLYILFYINYSIKLTISSDGIIQTSKYIHARKRAFIPFDKVTQVIIEKKKICIKSESTEIEFKNRRNLIKHLKKYINKDLFEYRAS